MTSTQEYPTILEYYTNPPDVTNFARDHQQYEPLIIQLATDLNLVRGPIQEFGLSGLSTDGNNALTRIQTALETLSQAKIDLTPILIKS